MKKVCFPKQVQNSTKVEKCVPFVVTYHALANKRTSIIRRNLDLFYMNQEVKNIFTIVPAVSFRIAWNISNYIVRVKLCSSERTVDSEKFGRSRREVKY